MPDIRYVCLSDLHFGAENSILSHLGADGVTVDPTTASAALEGLVAALRALVGSNEDRTTKPTLILNGDILELALASDNVALMVFDLFLDRLFPVDGEPLFAPTILYQPGNHDHHLWETARELQYGNLVGSLAPDEALPIPWHSSRMYYEGDPRPVSSELLNQLARRRPHRAAIDFRVSYPNLALRSSDDKTAVVFHHGHFVESIYLLMTTMKDFIFPDRPHPIDVWDIEAENFAWIDFFWSTLGRSGDVGEDVGLIYDMLQSDAAVRKLAGNLSSGIAQRLPRKGVVGRFRGLIRVTVDFALKRLATKIAASERKAGTSPLSPNAEGGLRAYLHGPLRRTLESEAPSEQQPLPDQVKFVFGHTHKPFVTSWTVPGFTNPVRLFNTGGWVVDTLGPEPMHGAAIVLIDENLEIACVRAYNQATSDAQYRVALEAGLPEEQGPFYRRLMGLVNAADEPWASLSAAAATSVTERQKALATIIGSAGAADGHGARSRRRVR